MQEYINYISVGNIAKLEGVDGGLYFYGDRLFEYTPDDIARRLDGLSEQALSFLKSLPTFLCSEVDVSNGRYKMLVKYGRLSELTRERDGVRIYFDKIIDFGEIGFDSKEQIQEILELDFFQYYRTHWAVRSSSAAKILSNLGGLGEDYSRLIASVKDSFSADERLNLPARSKETLGLASSVNEFLKLVYASPSDEGAEVFFRGHSDPKYELIPSLLRKHKNGDWQFMPNEDRLCQELLIAHYEEFQEDQYTFDRLVRMQHYGLPTRLLDITSNPLVALFFACEELVQEEGEVVIFRINSKRIKYYNSDTVSCISNISNLTFEQKGGIDYSLSQGEFNELVVIKSLLHHIKSEKGFFESRIDPSDLKSIVCVKAKRNNLRIKSQSGAFLLFGHEAQLQDSGQDGLKINWITISNKSQILEELSRININASTVYPSIESAAKHIKAKYLVPEELWKGL